MRLVMLGDAGAGVLRNSRAADGGLRPHNQLRACEAIHKFQHGPSSSTSMSKKVEEVLISTVYYTDVCGI